MTRGKLTLSVLSAIACLTLAMPAAHAGGGMGAGTGVTTCRLVLKSPGNQPQTMSLSDPYVSGDLIKVGALALVCDLPALGTTVNNPPYDTGSAVGQSANSVTCYTISNADQANIAAIVQDPFTEFANPNGGTQAVQLGAIQLLCVPAVTTNP